MEKPRWSAQRIGALIAGVVLCTSFCGLGQTAPGLTINFVTPFSNSNTGELSFWIGTTLFLLPAGALLGYGLHPVLWDGIQRIGHGLSEMNTRQLWLGSSVLFILAVALARIGRAVFLFDFPITDDEYAAQFGGQILSMGKMAVPAFEPLAALPTRFLFLHDGKLAAFDWPGIQLAWALSEWTRSGPWIFAVAAALPIPLLAIAVGQQLGRRWGAVAAGLAFLSPMMCMLSFTCHAHLLSRALLAVALCCYLIGEARSKLGWWVATGLGVGGAFFCRPMEIACLTAPLALSLLVAAVRRRPGAPEIFGGFLCGVAGPLVAFAIFNLMLTGNPLLPARFAPNPLVTDPWLGPLEGFRNPALLWYRFGSNTSHNLLMLAIWFGGPLGAVLAALGFTSNRLTRLLGWGVACSLGLGLLHSNSGLHLVGPIHYSECAVLLTLLAVHGMVRLKRWSEEKVISLPAIWGVMAGGMVVSLGTLCLWQSLALQRQAGIQRDIYGFLDSAGLRNAIVLAPRYGHLWQNSRADFRRTGSFVFEWRRPRPDWGDSVLILHDGRGVLEPLRRRFPDRTFFRLRAIQRDPYFELAPVDPNEVG